MSQKYERLYADTPDALGPPDPDIAGALDALPAPLDLLDAGCGQGRDALAAARLGHRVTGIDAAPSGIRALRAAARTEGLLVRGVVADLATWRPDGTFDVIVIDRTLHMLDEPPRHAVFARLLGALRPGGTLLLKDERRNIPGLAAVLEATGRGFDLLGQAPGRLFLRLNGAGQT